MRSIKWFLIIVLTIMLVLPASAQDDGITFIGDDPAKMQAMMEWLVGGYGPQIPGVTVYVGELPSDIDFELPQLIDGELLGAIDRPQGYGPPGTEFTEIFQRTTDTPNNVAEIYIESLTTAGWSPVDQSLARGGFEAAQNSYISLCQDDAEHSVTVEAFAIGDATNVIVRVMTPGEPFMCNPTNQPPVYDVAYTLLPLLSTPDGVEATTQQGGGGATFNNLTRNATTSVILITEKPASDLLAAYNMQLVDAGWTLVTEDSSDAIGQSIWSFDAEEASWGANLTIMQNPINNNEYLALLVIQETVD